MYDKWQRGYYVKELKQDLLGERAPISTDFRVILDYDPDICGVYLVVDGEFDTKMESAPVIGLFLATIHKYFSYQILCKERLRSAAHLIGTRRSWLRDNSENNSAIKRSRWFLTDPKFEKEVYCVHIRESNHQDIKERATNSLDRVCMEGFSSSVNSFEGYSHAIVIINDATGYCRLYEMKTRE